MVCRSFDWPLSGGLTTFIGSITTTPNSCAVVLSRSTVNSTAGCVNIDPSNPSSSTSFAMIQSCPPYIPPTTWSGSYKVQSGCNTGSCCCFIGNVDVTQTGVLVIRGTVKGQCNGNTSIVTSGFLGSSIATNISLPFLGTTMNASRSGDELSLDFTSTTNSQCHIAATCVSGSCYTPSTSSTSSGIGVLLAAPLVLLQIALSSTLLLLRGT